MANEIEVKITKVFVGRQMVTRSQKRYFDSLNIKECKVNITPNFAMLCEQWLQATKPKPIDKRRKTTAGSNVFSVDGQVQDVGSDFLPVPSPDVLPNISLGARPFIDPFRRTKGGFALYGRRRSQFN